MTILPVPRIRFGESRGPFKTKKLAIEGANLLKAQDKTYQVGYFKDLVFQWFSVNNKKTPDLTNAINDGYQITYV